MLILGTSNWEEFHELLPVHLFTKHYICFERGNHVFKSSDYSTMLYTDMTHGNRDNDQNASK